jgi:hypothetical protein
VKQRPITSPAEIAALDAILFEGLKRMRKQMKYLDELVHKALAEGATERRIRIILKALAKDETNYSEEKTGKQGDHQHHRTRA